MNDAPPIALLPTGLYDLLPPVAEREAEVTARLMAVLTSHGYQRVKPPLVEFEETLLSGAGAAMLGRAKVRHCVSTGIPISASST